MKNIYKTTIIYTCLLFGQTSEQIKQAKEIIQRTGMSESQVRDAAKARGYTQKQIDAAIQKGKVLQTKTKTPISDTLEEISLPELGKANKVEQEQPVLETVEPILGEKLSLTNKDDLQIIDELEENIVKIVSNNKILIKDLSSKDLKKIEEYLYLNFTSFFKYSFSFTTISRISNSRPFITHTYSMNHY